MKVLPHITDRDLDLSQERITEIQRSDIDLLQVYSASFHDLAKTASETVGAPVVIMCNIETEEAVPSALDWEGEENALRLHPAIYVSAKRALNAADTEREVVALLYHPSDDILSIYTVTPESADNG